MLARRFFYVSLGILAFALARATPAVAEVITIRSAAPGGPGALVPGVTMLVGPANSAFSGDFTNADFEAAANGSNAEISTMSSSWVPSLAADPMAQWINDDGTAESGRTVLYAVAIYLTGPFNVASIDLHYMVDNYLGESQNLPSGIDRAGIYVNGIALAGTNGIGDFLSEHFFTAEIGSLLLPGLNYVYLYGYDSGSAAGLIFSMTVTTSEVPNSTAEISWGAVKGLFR